MVAEAAGVSQMSVALVLGNAAKSPSAQKRVSEATRQRILRAAERLDYRPSRQAQILRGGRSGLIGVLKTISYQERNIRLVQAAGAAIRRHGYRIITSDVVSDESEVQDNLEVMIDLHVEGLIIEGGVAGQPSIDASFRRMLRKSGIPTAYLNCPATIAKGGYKVDYSAGMAALVEYLAENGYRRFTFASLVDTETPPKEKTLKWIDAECLEGFREGVRRVGIPEADAEIFWASKPRPFVPDYELGHETAKTLLERGPLPEVIVCHTDQEALGVIGALRQAGLAVPGDVGVTGFDDTELGCYSNIPLTTVGYDWVDIAETAVSRLIDRIEGRTAKAPPSVAFPCRIVPRRSTRCRTSPPEERPEDPKIAEKTR